MNPTNHQLFIAGQRLTVRSTAEVAYVQALAERVDERVRRANEQGAGLLNAALLAALGLAEELHRAQIALAELRNEVKGRADAILAALPETTRPVSEAARGAR